jgi:REP element-mobilizing transposase RayT
VFTSSPSCFNWLPLIELTNGYDLVYNFFDVIKQNGNSVLGFVIMPNHVHLLLHYANTKQSLNTVIGNGKRFIGYDLIKRLEQSGETLLLNKMKDAVGVKDRQRNKKHQLWQGTFEVKECRTEKFILQKLNYIHNNPCSGKWSLCDKPYNYEHSSARFYDGDKRGYKVKDYLDVLAELKYRE